MKFDNIKSPTNPYKQYVIEMCIKIQASPW